MVNNSKDGGDEDCLTPMEQALHCVPWQMEPREKLKMVKQALDKWEEGQQQSRDHGICNSLMFSHVLSKRAMPKNCSQRASSSQSPSLA